MTGRYIDDEGDICVRADSAEGIALARAVEQRSCSGFVTERRCPACLQYKDVRDFEVNGQPQHEVCNYCRWLRAMEYE
jgi:hypothetical protein